MKTFRNNSAQSMTNPWRRGLFKIVLAVFCIALIGHPAFSATVTWVGAEEGSAGNGYSVQNWSNPGVAKIYDLGGSEKYGVNGYYQIRPTPNSSPSNVSEAVSAGNNLGITAGTNPTLYSAPVFLNSSGVTGSAGTLVNFGGYSLYRGPDGSTSTLYRQGGLSVSVGSGPYNTPSGTNNGYFGNAFSLTMSSNMGADFRLGVAVDSVGTGSYAPDYVSIFNSSIGTTFSSQLSRNGSPDMAFFDVNANAGESFTAAMWQLAGSNSVAPVSLITFDVSRYKFDVASGQTTTNSVALSGSPAALVKTGDGTLLITSSNTYGGGTTISAGTVKLQGGSVTGNITNNGNLNISADLANSVSGTGSLTKSDAGNATLWSANTYTGATVVEAGQLRLDGSGAISSNSVVQVASGAGFSATGVFKTSNNLTIAGLTGAGQFYNAAGNLTVSKASGTSDVFTGSIDGGTGLIKEGTGTLALGGASTYTGNTTVSAGILLLANGSGLGSTSGGTTVASGAVLRLTNATGMTVGNEALTISGNGAGGSGGALRSVGGGNTWQGKVTLAAASTIGAASGASLTLDVASGNAIEAANLNLTLDGAGTIRINDAISLGSGGLNKNGSGTHYLSSINAYSGGTTIGAGRLVLSGAGRLGSGAVSVANANGGSLEFAVTGVNTMANAISGNGALLSSSGTTVLDGVVSSTGGLTVDSSTVRVGGSGSMSTATTVNSGGILDVAGTAGNVQVNSGGSLKGSGTVSALTIASGGTLAPGNSPGTLTASSATWNGGGTYAWEINNFLGSAGTNWDFLNITGGLTINASSGNKFIIDVNSLLASNNTSGAASNFDAFSNYSFAIATAAGGVSGFDASSFNILTSNFANNLNPAGATAAGSWYLTQSGNSINLNYAAATAIPEPSTGSLILLGLAAVLRRRKSSR